MRITCVTVNMKMFQNPFQGSYLIVEHKRHHCIYVSCTGIAAVNQESSEAMGGKVITLPFRRQESREQGRRGTEVMRADAEESRTGLRDGGDFTGMSLSVSKPGAATLSLH